MANDSLDYFERRVQSLESMYLYGLDQKQEPKSSLPEDHNMLDKLQKIETRLKEYDAKVPELPGVVQMLSKVYPMVSQRRRTLKETSEKVQHLLAQKDEVNQQLNSLLVLKGLVHVINKDNYSGKNLFILHSSLRLLSIDSFLQL